MFHEASGFSINLNRRYSIFCGKKFEGTANGVNRFCSNKCKSKFRRDSGIDDEYRICKVCGKKFKTNKYSKAKTCSRSCANKLRKLKDSPNLQE